MTTRIRVPGQGFVGSSSASPASPIVIISMNRAGHRRRRSLSSSNRYLSCRHGLGIGVANACDRLPGKANGAANSVGTCHPEGVDGVIARAGIALRGADQADLEYSQLGEPVPVGITECSLIDILGFVRVRVATRHLELQKVPKLPPPGSSFILSRASRPR